MPHVAIRDNQDSQTYIKVIFKAAVEVRARFSYECEKGIGFAWQELGSVEYADPNMLEKVAKLVDRGLTIANPMELLGRSVEDKDHVSL